MTVMTCCRPFFSSSFFVLFSFSLYLVSLATGLIMPTSSSSPFFVLFLSTSNNSTKLFFFVLFCPCNNRYLFLFFSTCDGVALAIEAFPFLSNLLASHSSGHLLRVVCFALLCFYVLCLALLRFALLCFVLLCFGVLCFVLL